MNESAGNARNLPKFIFIYFPPLYPPYPISIIFTPLQLQLSLQDRES